METLLGFSRQSLDKFFSLCLRAGVLSSLLGASLEDTIISLRQHAKEHNRKLQVSSEPHLPAGLLLWGVERISTGYSAIYLLSSVQVRSLKGLWHKLQCAVNVQSMHKNCLS